jgi:cyclophilin family peptidyl-prolyl cis-trans isomerase
MQAPKEWPSPPPMGIDPEQPYSVTIKTSLGEMTAELYPKDAPNTVNNFVFLSREGFYDGVIFHRIIKNFMIQGGDPQGTGTGGPGYKFPDEPVKGNYEVGSIAMANSGANTNGSQFFICEGQQCVTLPQKYNLFGKVTEGIDVVHNIAAVQTGANDRPVQNVTINTIEITEK